MDTTPIVAIAGIVGTLAGGLGGHYVQARLKDRGDRAAKLDEARTVLYLDAMTYTQREEAWLDLLQTPYGTSPAPLDVARAEVISAKMALFAPEHVAKNWEHLLSKSRYLSGYIEENEPEVLHYNGALDDIDCLLDVRQAISQLRSSLRQAFGAPDK